MSGYGTVKQVPLCGVGAAGLVTAMTGPGGRQLEFAYQWRPGGVVPLASASEQYGAVITECDDAGRVIATTDAEDRRTSVVRDAAGRVVESMDATGAVTRVDYSPEGWPWRMTYPDGSCSYATYDGEGNVIATRWPSCRCPGRGGDHHHLYGV